ncbi:MAG: GGDEF domain-containing protein, partial [Pseudomonadota bacterium]
QALTARTQQLVEALGTDALTGATSRAGLQSRGEEWLRKEQPFALMLLDLDGFKGVNDAHGHAAGDAVLIAMAQRLRQQVRADDVVARLGGDEFAVLVMGSPTRETLAAMATRMIEVSTLPVDYEGRSVTVGMSLGIARYPDDGSTLASLLRAADYAMYHSKQERSGPAYTFADDLDDAGMPQSEPARLLR